MARPLIEVEGLGVRFDSNWIFRNVTLSIPQGASAVLLGPSGAGKSVLLKTIAGLITASEGTIRVDSPELSMLFQKNALFDSLTVEENLLFPLKERKGITGAAARKRAAEMLQAVELPGTQKLMPSELSGGMQKRLGIARALMIEPEVLLYDDPTAGLDPITSRIIADLILRLSKERQMTLLTVTNDVHRAYQLGDRIYLLAHGKLIDGGTPDDVRHTKQPELRQFTLGLQEGPLT